MFANPIWYFVCIGAAVVIALLLNAYGNRTIDKARKDGMTDADIVNFQPNSTDDWYTDPSHPLSNMYKRRHGRR